MEDDITPLPAEPSAERKPRARDGLRWLAEGWQLVRRDPALWVTMALMYFAAAILLKRIPFLGNLMVILLTPIPLAGALLAARRRLEQADWAPRLGGSAIERWLRRPAAELARPFSDGEHAFPLLFACILVFGLLMVASVVEYLLTGGSFISGLRPLRTGPWHTLAIVGTVFVAAIYAVLAMALMFLLHEVLFAGRQAMSAMAASFRLCAHHAAPVAVFAAPFVASIVLIGLGYTLVPGDWLGYLLTFTLGTAAVALFATGSQYAFRALAD